jgi:hypothetical protein
MVVMLGVVPGPPPLYETISREPSFGGTTGGNAGAVQP